MTPLIKTCGQRHPLKGGDDMIIRIKGNDVILEDEKLTTLFLTTGQLLELVKVINVSTR